MPRAEQPGSALPGVRDNHLARGFPMFSFPSVLPLILEPLGADLLIHRNTRFRSSREGR